MTCDNTLTVYSTFSIHPCALSAALDRQVEMDPLQVITEALDVLDPHRVDNAERAAVVCAAIHAKGFCVVRDVALPELETV